LGRVVKGKCKFQRRTEVIAMTAEEAKKAEDLKKAEEKKAEDLKTADGKKAAELKDAQEKEASQK
jgi:hypothetical protein